MVPGVPCVETGDKSTTARVIMCSLFIKGVQTFVAKAN